MRFLLAMSAILFAGAMARAEVVIPPRPYRFVADASNSLSASTRAGLERLLNEHAHAAGETIFLAVMPDTGGEDVAKLTSRIFETWNVASEGNGALLVLFTREKKARLQAGYALESNLGEARAAELVKTSVLPDLRRGDVARAASLGTLEILRALASPVVQSGEAQNILRESGFQGAFEPQPPSVTRIVWPLWLLVGLILFAWVANWILAAEAHFTSSGWYRPSPLRRVPKGTPTAAGGASGQW